MSSIAASALAAASFANSTSFRRDIPGMNRLWESFSDGRLGYVDTAQIVSEYMVANRDPFGSAAWREHFGIDVGPEIPFGKGFHEFWNGPDPVDVFNGVLDPRPVSETHLLPVFGWQFGTKLEDNSLHARSLQTLNQLGLQFFGDSLALRQNRNKKAGPPCWLIMRKGVEARNQPWLKQQQFVKDVNAKTQAGYEEKPSAKDIATVILPYKQVYRELHLGNPTGAEKQWTYSRCEETVKYKNKNSDVEYPLILGGSDPSDLEVNDRRDCDRAEDGVALMRKF